MGWGELMRATNMRRYIAGAFFAVVLQISPAAWAQTSEEITILDWRTSPTGEIEVRQSNGEWAWRPAPSLPKPARLVPSLQLWEVRDDAGQPIIVEMTSIKKMKAVSCPRVTAGDVGHDRQASGFGGHGC